MDHYDSARDISEAFFATVARWIEDQGEAFVILRYLRAAGRKDYAFCRSIAVFRNLCNSAAKGTDIVVFRQSQLPFRGTVTEGFIQMTLDAVADGTEYLVVALEPAEDTGIAPWGSMGDSHSELREDLSERVGRSVAVGCCPPFCDPDNDQMISASKGGIDGPR